MIPWALGGSWTAWNTNSMRWGHLTSNRVTGLRWLGWPGLVAGLLGLSLHPVVAAVEAFEGSSFPLGSKVLTLKIFSWKAGVDLDFLNQSVLRDTADGNYCLLRTLANTGKIITKTILTQLLTLSCCFIKVPVCALVGAGSWQPVVADMNCTSS